MAIKRKLINSFVDCLAAPYAILLGTEIADLLICSPRQYLSSAGKDFI